MMIPDEPSISTFVDSQDFGRRYMAEHMEKLTGHKMSEIETWQYLAWVATSGIQRMLYVCDDRTAEVLGQVLHTTALDFHGRYVASKTGIFPPPSAELTRFESPEEFVQRLTKMQQGKAKDVSPETHSGYL